MSVTYATTLKTSRMTAVRDAINTGTLELGTTAMAVTISSATLNASAGTISGAVLTLSGFPKSSAASAGGRVAAARIRNASAVDQITGLTVGMSATAWAASTAYAVGNLRANGAGVYRVTVAGTSAASGGPTGTGSAITDGSVTWEYLALSSADLILDAVDITAGQTVTINASPTFTHA